MVGKGGRTRFIVACEGCGSIYVATETSDGTILPTGIDKCSCGGTEYTRVTESDIGISATE